MQKQQEVIMQRNLELEDQIRKQNEALRLQQQQQERRIQSQNSQAASQKSAATNKNTSKPPSAHQSNSNTNMHNDLSKKIEDNLNQDLWITQESRQFLKKSTQRQSIDKSDVDKISQISNPVPP